MKTVTLRVVHTLGAGHVSDEPCGHRTSGRIAHTTGKPFFPLALKPDNHGPGVAKDSPNSFFRSKSFEAIGIAKSLVFFHAYYYRKSLTPLTTTNPLKSLNF
jgi:hypothetical protein